MNPEHALPEIFINGRFLTQRVTGVQSFAHSICEEFKQSGVVFKFLIPAEALIHPVSNQVEAIRIGNQKGHLWEQFQLPAFMKGRPDSMLLNLCNSAPMHLANQVVTLHDLAFLHHPEWFSLKFRLWYNYMIPRAVKSAKSILTVSESSLKEIQESYGIPPAKIFQTGNKVSNEFLEVESDAGVSGKVSGKKFFLLVGSNDPRKNFSVAEKFIAGLPGDAVLVIAGGSHQSFAKTSHDSSDRIVRLGYVTSGELKWLYQNAIALINPSRYEGFGIPNLEAMSQNCAVICSDIAVFREVCADAAFYFSPDNPESLKSQAEYVQNTPEVVYSKKMIGNSIFTSYQKRDRASVILKALTR